jgi:hypothetical protein
MAGTRGPVPKRSTQRRRQNKPETPVTTGTGALKVRVPPAEDHWHPLAARWYESLAESGQARWYEPSDWATAQYLAEAMSRNLLAGAKFSAVLFASVMSGMSNLLVTEGDRRRARLELERAGEGGDAGGDVVSELADYRDRAARSS